MQREPACGRHGLLDRQPRELVAELHVRRSGHQHPGGEALIEPGLEPSGEPLHQRQLDLTGDDRNRVKHGSGRLGQARRARQNGVTNGFGQQQVRSAERLGHEERIAAGSSVQIVAIDSERLRQLADRGLRQRCELQPASAAAELAEHDPQLLGALELVISVAREHQRRHRGGRARQQHEHIERRLVGPVDILEHEHRGPAALEVPAQGRRDLMRTRSRLDERLELASDRGCDVPERAERSRGSQRRAGAPEDPQSLRVAEAPQQRRLPDPRLAADEQDPPLRGGPHLGHMPLERRQRIAALEQRRRPEVRDLPRIRTLHPARSVSCQRKRIEK